MKPNQQQQVTLREYLAGIFIYREPFDEVFDHLMCALERYDDQTNFKDAVNEIIQTDFGGHQKFKQLEKTANKMAVAEGFQRYIRYFARSFKGIDALAMLIIGVGFYLLLGRLSAGSRHLFYGLFFSLLIFVPMVLELYRYFKQGYVFGKVKRSVKDTLFSQLSAVPVRGYLVYVMGGIVFTNMAWNIPQLLAQVLMTVVLVASLAYLLAFIKMYKDEFRAIAVR